MRCRQCEHVNAVEAAVCGACGASSKGATHDGWTPPAHVEALDLRTGDAARSPLTSTLSLTLSGAFVGRQREIEVLRAALAEALAGHGRLAMLVGEPGIGKTRTAQELTTYAERCGAQVLWGRGYENPGAPPFWPWVQVLRSYIREGDADQICTEMGAGAADIAGIVPDVRSRLPDLPSLPPLEDPEQARFRLFDSMTSFLTNAARAQPRVLVLDNLHWADKPSLLLLEFLAREIERSRLLVVGTYRDAELSRQHPLSETLGELARERLFQRVLLLGLEREDVGHFMADATGMTPPPGLVEAVHQQTEGNPLFMTDVVRLLVHEGVLIPDTPSSSMLPRDNAGQSVSIRIPEGVREVSGKRLNRLSSRCNQMLSVASVLGRAFSLAELRGVADDLSEDRLLETLEEALAARIIEEIPQAVGRYQFTHALIRETLYDEVTRTRRVRLHRDGAGHQSR